MGQSARVLVRKEIVGLFVVDEMEFESFRLLHRKVGGGDMYGFRFLVKCHILDAVPIEELVDGEGLFMNVVELCCRDLWSCCDGL